MYFILWILFGSTLAFLLHGDASGFVGIGICIFYILCFFAALAFVAFIIEYLPFLALIIGFLVILFVLYVLIKRM